MWTLDGNLQDFYGNYPGVGVNEPTYSFPGISGFGQCLHLTASLSQSVTVSATLVVNLANASFTVEAWIKITTLYNTTSDFYSDNTIFGQYQQSIQDESLYLGLRNKRLYMGF